MTIASLAYRIGRPFLLRIDAEKSHHLALRTLPLLTKLSRGQGPYPAEPIHCMGLTFPNPVGLAAGLDKDGKAVHGLAAWGFGFVEVGTVTPQPQAGNDKPRLFRLRESKAIINRMGFNNDGVQALSERLAHVSIKPAILGINIGKNKTTPNQHAIADYLKCFTQVYAKADYITVNLSSPNTPGLRDLQGEEFITLLMDKLREQRERLAQHYDKHVPIAIKIAPDLSNEGLDSMARTLIKVKADAVIATNTTIDKTAIAGHPLAQEAGGLSGAPLYARSNEVIARLARALDGELPIIGVGGINTGAEARAKREAGATLVQLYSGLIYRGPALVQESVDAIGAK